MTNFLTAKWENLIMANYPIAPELLLPYLPHGVELDFYEGKTYVSLVGFMFKDIKIFGVPIPFWGTFEEVNLRFYVVQKIGNETIRGVVFINETVPSKLVAVVANYLYKEHYISIPTKHSWQIDAQHKQIEYQWKNAKVWNCINVNALAVKNDMPKQNIETFIFERYFGFTKINKRATDRYQIVHQQWKLNEVVDYNISCDFEEVYGASFATLNGIKPDTVLLAEGSNVAVRWKRIRF